MKSELKKKLPFAKMKLLMLNLLILQNIFKRRNLWNFSHTWASWKLCGHF
jgi:hypothetical protein